MFSLANIDWQPILEGSEGPPLLVFCVAGIVIVAVVATIQWRRVRIAEAEASMKMRMIEHGYTPDQIDQVLRAKVDKSRRWRCREDELNAARASV